MTESGETDTLATTHSDATAEANAAGAAGKRRLGLGFWIAVAWLTLVIFAAVFAPWLPFKDPDANFIESGERPPSRDIASTGQSSACRARARCSA